MHNLPIFSDYVKFLRLASLRENLKKSPRKKKKLFLGCTVHHEIQSNIHVVYDFIIRIFMLFKLGTMFCYIM